MHKVLVKTPRYDLSRPYTGQTGEVIGHWGPENSSTGRDGYLVEFEDGKVVGLAIDEVEDVSEP